MLTKKVVKKPSEPFTAESTEAYVKHRLRLAGCPRMPFTPEALLAVHQREPRSFSAEEATLLEQVAERMWFAVDRTRAEAALR